MSGNGFFYVKSVFVPKAATVDIGERREAKCGGLAARYRVTRISDSFFYKLCRYTKSRVNTLPNWSLDTPTASPPRKFEMSVMLLVFIHF